MPTAPCGARENLRGFHWHRLRLALMRATVAANLDLRAKAPSVDVVEDLAQVVAALDAGFYRAEDFADCAFAGIRAGGALHESNEVGEELAADESAEVVAAEGGVLVDLSVLDC